MFWHSSVSVSSLSIPKYTLLFPSAKWHDIKSSPFKISFVSFGIYLFNIPAINSEWAFLIIESLNKFVQIRYVGVKYGYTLLALRSSISNTAIFFLVFPKRLAPLINVVATPEFTFDPKLLSHNYLL